MDVVAAIISRLAQHGAGVLPKGGSEWLRKHPKQARRFYEDLADLQPNQYVEFLFAVSSTVWAGEEDHAVEKMGYVLHQLDQCSDLKVEWTGDWRIEAIPWEAWRAAKEHEE